MKRHTIRLTGPSATGPRLSLQALRELAEAVLSSAQQAVRLRAEGRGVVSGPVPMWLERASAFDLVGLEAGSTQVIVEAPTLAESVPERFAQADFFSALDPNATAIDVLEESLVDALAENATSERLDGALVKTFAAFGKLFRYGIDGLEFGGAPKIRVDATSLARLERLQVLRIEADAIEAAADGPSVLSRVPSPLFPALDLRSLHKPQGPRSGVAAVMGRWPGDETDEETEALLAELS
jgi:hypothetical protein